MQVVDRLEAIGETIKESHVSVLLLCSLLPSYETLITALEALNEAELTPSFIQDKLTDEYNRRHDNENRPGSTVRAFKAQKKLANRQKCNFAQHVE